MSGGGGSGGGDQYRVAADEAEASATLARLQSEIIQGNVRVMGDRLRTSLQIFDDTASQQLGSAALSLARSGNLTRRRADGFASREQLGIKIDIADPAEAWREQLADAEGRLSALQEERSSFDSQRGALQAGVDTQANEYEESLRQKYGDLTNQYIEELRESGYDGNVPEEAKKMAAQELGISETLGGSTGPQWHPDSAIQIHLSQYRDELQAEANTQISEIDAAISEFESENMNDDGTYHVEESISHLSELVSEIETQTEEFMADNGDIANADIDTPGALRYAGGSTLTQVSKSLQRIYMERDSIMNDGFSGIIGMVNDQLVAEKQAEMSQDSAARYMGLASAADEYDDRMRFNQNLSNILGFAGMAAGAVAGSFIPVGGTAIGAGAGASLGGAAGSFLGNAFAR